MIFKRPGKANAKGPLFNQQESSIAIDQSGKRSVLQSFSVACDYWQQSSSINLNQCHNLLSGKKMPTQVIKRNKRNKV